MPTIKISSKFTEAIHEYIARRRVRPAVMDHLEQSLAENAAVGQLLARLSTLEPPETSFPDADKNLPPPDDVTL
jgi:hypothetical protein